MKKALLFLADGVEEVEALAPLDILRRAGMETLMVSVQAREMITGSHGVRILADCLLDQLRPEDKEADAYILPGGMPGALTLAGHESLHGLLLEANRQGKLVAAICAAPMVLGKLGLLKAKEATCYPGLESELKGAKLSDQPVVLDGNILTAKGVGYAFDFGYGILKALTDAEEVKQLKAKMLYPYK